MPTLTPAAVRAQIKAGTPDPIYLLVGEDDVEKGALAAEFADVVDEGLRAFNVERIHAGEWTSGDKLAAGAAAIVSSARTLPMMAPRRVVVVLGAETLLIPKRDSEAAEAALEGVAELFARPEPQTTLVLVAATVDKRRAIYKVLAKHGTIVECGVLLTIVDAERWVKNRVAAAGADIDVPAARLLAERAGFPERPPKDERPVGDIRQLRGDVDRLLLYGLGQARLTLADAREIAGPAALQDEWALANAVRDGRAADALKQLALMFDAGGVPEMILGQLAHTVRRDFPAIAPDSAAAAVDALFRADTALKRSNRSSDQPRMLLERLVVELCAGKRVRGGYGPRRW